MIRGEGHNYNGEEQAREEASKQAGALRFWSVPFFLKGRTMAKGGKREGAGRPRVEQPRVRLTVRVKAQTKSFFKEKGRSAGRILDEIAEEQSK